MKLKVQRFGAAIEFNGLEPLENRIQRIKREFDNQPIRPICDPWEVNFLWATPLGQKIARRVDWPSLMEVLAQEVFPIYRRVA